MEHSCNKKMSPASLCKMSKTDLHFTGLLSPLVLIVTIFKGIICILLNWSCQWLKQETEGGDRFFFFFLFFSFRDEDFCSTPALIFIWVVAEKADKAWRSKKEVGGNKVSGHTSTAGVVVEESLDVSATRLWDGVLSVGILCVWGGGKSTSSDPGG